MLIPNNDTILNILNILDKKNEDEDISDSEYYKLYNIFNICKTKLQYKDIEIFIDEMLDNPILRGIFYNVLIQVKIQLKNKGIKRRFDQIEQIGGSRKNKEKLKLKDYHRMYYETYYKLYYLKVSQ